MEERVLIVVPVYNAVRHLSTMVESVLGQTYVNWRLVLVDDGSTDGSQDICDSYAQRDSRIHVIHKSNAGVSTARNAGINYLITNNLRVKIGGAIVSYLYFADADDSLPADALQTLVHAMAGDVDFVIAGYNCYDEDGALRVTMPQGGCVKLTTDEALSEMYAPRSGNYQGYLWNKLFRLDIIARHGVRFDEDIQFNEDRLFVTKYICAATQGAAYTTTPVYYYVRRQDGAMGSLEQAYNRKFATDFDAYARMRLAVLAKTTDKRVRRLAIEGLCSSYRQNHRLMIKHHNYDSGIHRRLLRGLIKNGGLLSYLTGAIRIWLIDTLMLICPKILSRLFDRKGIP